MYAVYMYVYMESIYSNVKEIRMVVAIRLFNNEHQ
jgi:hypothetical protein